MIPMTHRSMMVYDVVTFLLTLTAIFSPQLTLKAPSFVQASCYNGNGSKYERHRDNKPLSRRNIDDDAAWLSQPEQRQRYITCILYLTPVDWSIDDGGGLRCYLGCEDNDDIGYSAKEIVNIEPKFGRLVIFSSHHVLHEVLPTHRPGRYALTVWLMKED